MFLNPMSETAVSMSLPPQTQYNCYPTSEAHVSAAVLCAKKLGIQLKIRSGGHDYEGISYVSDTTFVILDMFNFRSINVNMEDETAWCNPALCLANSITESRRKAKSMDFPPAFAQQSA
ncbi:UNVERIFIED_CONTAM: Berberine bridge enzyme-like 21 [Sesamum latifolium]|uniref:Berberine bridge enzyme-like 21 n=1 Tax=Sesamum latifolium TaxID=2727402 RepID=A0AAW2WNQ9_9LAMI